MPMVAFLSTMAGRTEANEGNLLLVGLDEKEVDIGRTKGRDRLDLGGGRCQVLCLGQGDIDVGHGDLRRPGGIDHSDNRIGSFRY